MMEMNVLQNKNQFEVCPIREQSSSLYDYADQDDLLAPYVNLSSLTRNLDNLTKYQSKGIQQGHLKQKSLSEAKVGVYREKEI